MTNSHHKSYLKQIAIPFLVGAFIIIVLYITFGNTELFFERLLKQSSVHASSYAWVSFAALSLDIVLPVPSSIVMYTNGWVLGLMPGALLSSTSLMIGAIVGYYLGKYTSYGLKSKTDPKAQLLINKYGKLAILITRGIPVLSESICMVCGYNKMRLPQYLLFNLIGYLPLSILYAYFGQAGYSHNNFLLSFACSLIIAAAFWFFGQLAILNPATLQQKGG